MVTNRDKMATLIKMIFIAFKFDFIPLFLFKSKVMNLMAGLYFNRMNHPRGRIV